MSKIQVIGKNDLNTILVTNALQAASVAYEFIERPDTPSVLILTSTGEILGFEEL